MKRVFIIVVILSSGAVFCWSQHHLRKLVENQNARLVAMVATESALPLVSPFGQDDGRTLYLLGSVPVDRVAAAGTLLGFNDTPARGGEMSPPDRVRQKRREFSGQGAAIGTDEPGAFFQRLDDRAEIADRRPDDRRLAERDRFDGIGTEETAEGTSDDNYVR